MKNQLSTVTEVVVRSIFYIITNYVFVSMGLSFHTHWIAILFLLSMVWATIDYGESVNKITGKKVIAEILCICCIAISIAIAYFVGYIQGAIISFWKHNAITLRLSYQYEMSFQNWISAAHRRPVKAVSLKKICCFFVARLRSRPFCPVRIVVVSEREIFLPRRLAFLIFVRSKKQRENKPFRLANFKARWCREWKEKFSAP